MAALRSVRTSPNRFEATRTSKSCGRLHQIHARGIHEQRLGPDVGIVARDVREHAIPESHAEPLRVGLGDRRQQAFPPATTRELERKPDDPLSSVTREDSRLHRHFVRVPRVQRPADLRVLALRVLAHDDEVDVARIAPRERAAHARVEHGRPHARVLIEPAANREQQAVERHVVLQPGIADGAEEDRVERPQHIQRVGRHHSAVLEVVVRSPRERLPREPHVHLRACRVDRAHRGGRHLAPDAVTRNYRHTERFHRVTIDEGSSTRESRPEARSPGAPARSRSRRATIAPGSHNRRQRRSVPARCRSAWSRR